MADSEVKKDYRDKIATVDEKGKRIWVYPKKPKGRYYNARTILSLFLLAFFILAPLIKVNGEPFLLFNIFERKFILFGIIFWPQDFYLFGLAMITIVVFIILFTVVFGRLFCGWACPQTVFMEMFFRKIEYWIEGDANQQRKLAKAPWTGKKIIKKGIKHAIFFSMAFIVGNAFMAWMISFDQWLEIVTKPPTENLAGFTAVMVFSGIFYFVFAYFREQACTVVCPYGRLQGALLDDDSIVIHYDNVRGEPRGKMKKQNQDNPIQNIENKLGDCIDCTLCVQVCPTGIDIRHGTQLECVNCTACIDACDEVMDKIDRPRGLIRYASHNSIEKKQPFKFTKKAMAYSVVLVVLVVVLGFSLGNRSNFETTLLRTPGTMYYETEPGMLSNLYNIQFINKSNDSIPIKIVLASHTGKIRMVGNQNITIPPKGITKGIFFIDIPKTDIDSRKTKVKLELQSMGKVVDAETTNFLGPIN